jgi:hypothetical protein
MSDSQIFRRLDDQRCFHSSKLDGEHSVLYHFPGQTGRGKEALQILENEKTAISTIPVCVADVRTPNRTSPFTAGLEPAIILSVDCV